MKRLLLVLALLLSLTLGLAACSGEAPEVDGLSELSGCYALSSGEYYVGDELRESYSATADGEPRLIFKLREDGVYFIRLDGRSDSGTATLSDGTLTLSGDLEPFSALGEVISARIDFGDTVLCTVALSSEGEAARLIAVLAPTANYDDSYFGDTDGGVSFVGVEGLREEGYPLGGFDPKGVVLVFDMGDGGGSCVDLAETEYICQDGEPGYGTVEGEYLGCPFTFEIKINLPTVEFPNATAVYSPEGVEHLPSLPSGYTFHPTGDTRFFGVGNWLVAGEVRYGGVMVSFVSSYLTVTPLAVTDYPTELTFRAEGEVTELPDGLLDDIFTLDTNEFYVGDSEAMLRLASSNYCFPDGSTEQRITVRVLPPLVSSDELEWVIPEEKLEYSPDWREKMPYLTYRGERLEGVVYNYEPREMDPGFVAGEYTVEADLTDSGIELDGELDGCTVELATRVLQIPEGGEHIYTGSDVSALPDYFGEGLVEASGSYLAAAVGDYTYTLTVPSDLFASGALCFEGGVGSVTVEWSVVKAGITLTVDDSDFDLGFEFGYDGTERRFSATATGGASVVIYVNGTRYEYLSDVVFRKPGTYEVRIEVEDDTYAAEPYERTVKISRLALDISALGLSWQSSSLIYNGSAQEKLLDTEDLPYYVEVIYDGNTATGAGSYHATATFRLNESYPDEAGIYYLTDPDYALECDWSISPATLTKPEVTDGRHYDYNGGEYVFYNASALPRECTVTGNTGVNAGEYTLTVTLSENYIFSDGTAELVAKWYIDADRVEIGELSLRESCFEWKSDTVFTPYVYNLDRLLEYYDYTMTGDPTASEPGEYTVTYTLTKKSAYKSNPNVLIVGSSGEELGESLELTFDYTVDRAYLTAPTVTGSYVYTGDDIIPALSGLDTALLEVDYPTCRDAGDYSLTVRVKDAVHYVMTDAEGNEVTELELSYTVAKASLTVPDYIPPITVFDGTRYTVSLLLEGVGGEKFDAALTLTEDGATVSAIYGAGTYKLTVTGAAGDAWQKNYEAPERRIFTFSVARADIDLSALTWSHTEWVYTGTSGIPEVVGLPDTVSQDLTLTAGSGGINAYDGYEVTATLTSSNYNTATLTTAFKILRRGLALPTLGDEIFVYDGELHTVTYTAKDPTFGAYAVSVSGDSAIAAGEHYITFTVSSNFYFTVDGEESDTASLPWQIAKADYDLTSMGWSGTPGARYPSNGEKYSFYLTGLPEGLTAEYTGQGAQAAGNHCVTATLVNNNTNYNDPAPEPSRLTFYFTLVGVTSGDWTYYVSGDYAYVTAYGGSAAEVTLPSEIGGYPVASVGSAFRDHGEITYLDLSAMPSFGVIDSGGLSGLDALRELSISGLSDGRLLSDLFGGSAPTTLTALHIVATVSSASGTATAFMVKTLDCPSLRELYISTVCTVDFEDVVFDLDFMYFYSSRSECLILDFDWDDPLSVAYGGSATLKFGAGDVLSGYIISANQTGFTGGVYAEGGVTVYNDDLFVLSQDGTATYMGTRRTGDITVPDSLTYGGSEYTVTAVSYAALYGRSDLTSFTVPDSVTHIGGYALAGCTALTEVAIGSGVTTLGSCILTRSDAVTSLTFASGGVWTNSDATLEFDMTNEASALAVLQDNTNYGSLTKK